MMNFWQANARSEAIRDAEVALANSAYLAFSESVPGRIKDIMRETRSGVHPDPKVAALLQRIRVDLTISPTAAAEYLVGKLQEDARYILLRAQTEAQLGHERRMLRWHQVGEF